MYTENKRVMQHKWVSKLTYNNATLNTLETLWLLGYFGMPLFPTVYKYGIDRHL